MTQLTTVDSTVITQDRQLVRAAAQTRVELARHRWHWTMDPTNPKRVSLNDYAKSIGRRPQTVIDLVSAYDEWRKMDAPPVEFADYHARHKLRGDAKAATVAVAKAKGISVESARRHHGPEVREVATTAREKATVTGGEYEDEVTTLAQKRAASSARAKSERTARKRRHTMRFVQTEGKLAQAAAALRWVLKETKGVQFTPEESEELVDQLGRLKAMVSLLEVQIGGATDVDWDREMAKLTMGDAR